MTESVKKTQEALRETYQKTMDHLHLFGAFYQGVVDAMPAESVTYISFYTSSMNMSVNGNKDVLVKAIRVLRTKGFETTARAPSEKQSEYSATFKNQNGPSIFLMFTSTQCQRVKIGTKLVEEDVYEVVCSE